MRQALSLFQGPFLKRIGKEICLSKLQLLLENLDSSGSNILS